MGRLNPKSRQFLIFVVYILLHSYPNVSSSKLTSSGGYSVVLAISEDYPVPSEEAVEGYIQNIRGILNQFSIRLWTASRGTFFIQDVSVKIPTNWKRDPGLESQVGVAATESYNTADIRISPDFLTPHVENPNACGISGQFIELPLSLFENSVTGRYGPPAAALLNQWARFRYGVWEEHGYPSEERFPYFYKKPNASSWQMNGCSDYPISGKYMDSSNDLCDNGDLSVPLDKDCRFTPDALNTAQSSYMTFHWLNSIQEFCDEDTHNSEAPNRQNYFCGHRSIWEVLRQTSDFKSVTNQLDGSSVPVLTLSVVRTSQNPRFYVLIDQGRTEVAPYVLNDLLSNVTSFFTGDLSTVAAVGTFPAGCESSSNKYVSEKIEWTSLAGNRDLFVETLNEISKTSTVNRPLIRDFGRAILEVVQNINSFEHEAGAVLLVIKTGTAENTFEHMTYEKDVIAEVHKFGNVKIYATELVKDASSPFNLNLQTLALETGGKHVVITKSYDIRTKFIPVAGEILEVLSSPILRIEDGNFVIIQREYVLPDTHVKIPILLDDLTSLEFHLTTSRAVRTGEIVLTPDSMNARNFLSVKNEWNEELDRKKRSTHSFRTTENISKNTTWTLYYPCVGELSDCRAHLIVVGKKLRPAVDSAEKVEIIVSTSAENNIVDMSHFNDHESVQSPFSVFAKVTQNRRPVRNLIVNAKIELLDGSESWTIELIDDGKLRPDISKHDGIYSGIFLPPKDALYKIFATVRTSASGSDDPELEVISKSLLLPKDQTDMECTLSSNANECTSTTLTRGSQQVVEFPGQITVINSITFMPGRPFRITDFQVITASNYVVYFVFTSPELLGVNDVAKPDQYNFYYSPRLKSLIGTVDGNAVMGAMIGSPAGETVIFQYATMQEVTVYYAVEAVYGSLRSGPSNIVGVKTVQFGNDSAIPTMPTTTTFTTQTPTISTTSTRTTTPVTTTTGLSSTTTGPTSIPTSKMPSSEKSAGGTSTIGTIMSVLAVIVLVLGASGIFFYRPHIFRKSKTNDSNFTSTSSLDGDASLDRSNQPIPNCTSISFVESV